MLGPLLVTEGDVDFLHANADAPMTNEKGGEYYEAPPTTELCRGGASADIIAAQEVFIPMAGPNDYLYFGQWISGEPADARESPIRCRSEGLGLVTRTPLFRKSSPRHRVHERRR